MTRRAVDLASFLGGALLAAGIIAAGIAARVVLFLFLLGDPFRDGGRR